MSKLSQKLKNFGYGAAVGLTSLSICLASVPSKNRVTDDTAIYQNLSDIRVARQGELNFDQDIAKLSQLEGRYKEKLPALKNARVRGPMQRISQQRYSYSGARSASSARPAARE